MPVQFPPAAFASCPKKKKKKKTPIQKDPIKSVTEKSRIFQIDTALPWVTEAKILFKKSLSIKLKD